MFKSVFKTGIRGIYNVSENTSFQTDTWSIYPAKHKQNGKVVSVFIFDKTKFESLVYRICSQSPNTKNPKLIISECYELIKFEVSQLTKLKHPQVLTIIEVLEETKLKFLFVSEAVVANLSTLDLEKEDDLSLQKGLLEVSKGIQFLHNFCSIIHMNLQPTSVYVTSLGDWKLAGFRFLQNLNDISPLERENFYIMNNSSVVPFANLNLNFTAPELIIDSSSSQRLSTANDLWSLGLLIYYLYNRGDCLISLFDSNSPSDFKGEFRKFEQKFYNHRPSELRFVFKNIPENLWLIMTQLLARFPHDRMSIDQFIDSDYFNGSLIKMMWFIDEFSTKSLDEKLLFLEGLLNEKEDLLSKLPITFKNAKLLPLLIEVITSEISVLSSKKLTSETDKLISDALSIVLKIGRDLSSLSFQDRIYEPLLNVTKSRKADASPLSKLIKTSVKVRYGIVSNMDILLKKLQLKQLTAIVKEIADLCLTYTATEVDLQADQIKLQDLLLDNISMVAELFDFPYIKNTLFPLLCQVFKTTTVLSTKLQSLATFKMLIDKKVIDRTIVGEQLLPILENLKSRDKRIVSRVLQFFVGLSQSEHISLDLEVLVDRVLVQCLRLAFGCSDCCKQEFKDMMKLINSIEQSLTERKLDVLAEGTNGPATNFDSLINTPLLRHGDKEGITKAPTLKPMVPASQKKPPTPKKDAVHVMRSEPNKVKPLMLKPQKAPLRFGATSAASSRAMNGNANHARPKQTQASAQNDEDNEFDDFQTSSPDSLGKSNQVGSIDWSSAKIQSAPKTSNQYHQVLQPQNVTTGNAQPTNAFAGVKSPPGFDANMVLTPNLSGGFVPAPKKTNNSNDLLDFL